MNGQINSHFPNCDRRNFLKKITVGSAGLSIGTLIMEGCTANGRFLNSFKRASSVDPGSTQVSFVRGTDRREIVYEALKPFENHFRESIKDKQVVIKVNFVGQGNPLGTTHPDSVRGVLDFLKPLYDRTVIVGESKGFLPSFEHYGYFPLRREYNVKLVELWESPTTYHWIIDGNLYPNRIRIFNPYLDPNNYFISVTRLKTHNAVIATLTLKNVVMGSPMKIPKLKINDKTKMHATGKSNNSPKMLHFNLFLMAHRVHPDFSVLDGFEGMQGNGPVDVEPVDHKVALAGPDFVAVDRIGSELMAIPWEGMGYLNYCADAGLGQGDRSKIKIIGPDPRDYVIPYKLHKNIEWQYKWKDDLILRES